MTVRDLNAVKASTGASVREAVEVIDRSAMAVALLVDEDDILVGLLTDGDIRRALLGGATLADAALPYATKGFQRVEVGSSRALVLDLMRALRINAVPEVDEMGRLVGLHTLSDVIGKEPLPNPALLMAGGRGSRLGDLTRHTPKPLMDVAGRSILEWIVLNLVGGGVREVFVAVNHMAEQVVDHLGDGHALGCRVSYIHEEPTKPLGTAGALSLFRADHPDLDVPLLVMNADLMVQFDPERLLDFHVRTRASISVAVRTYSHEVPFGVVETDATRVTGIREKPTFTADVNAGVYAVSPEVLDLLVTNEPCTMPDLIERCLDEGHPVSAWPIPSDWIDIGTPSDLARAKGQL
jgi:dTDP-glucose pyrophosphorylase